MFFFLFFLTTDIYFLIPAIIVQFYNPTAKLTMPIGIASNEIKSKN